MTIDQVLSTKMLLLKHLLQYQLPLPTWISCHLCGWSSSITWISFTPVLLLLQYQLQLPNSISSVFCWVFQSQCFGIDVDRFRKVHNYSSSIVVYEDALLQHLLQYWLPPPKWCLAIYAVWTVPLLGSISLQCCYCSSICYKYLLSKPTLRLQIQRIHNSATKRKILLSMQLEYFQFLNLLHSSVATATVSVTTTSCRRRDSRSWKVQHTNRRPWALLLTQHLSQSLLSMPKSKFVVSAAKNSSILWILVLQCCYCSTSVEQPAVSFNVVVPAVSLSGSVQHIILISPVLKGC